jgi:DUF4097 and DUF4098 domain-containing protein YvlB
MKKITITATIIIILGIGICGFAYFSGADFKSYFTSFNSLFEPNTKVTFLEDFNELKLDINNSNLYVIYEDRLDTEVNYYKSEDIDFNVEITSNSMLIKENSKFRFTFFQNNGSRLEIRIPKDKEPYRVTGLISSGKLDINSEITQVLTSINLKINSGEINLDNLEVDLINIKVNSGFIKFNNLKCNNLEVSIDSGSFNASNIAVLNKTLIDIDSGFTKLDKSSLEDLEIRLSSGTININDSSFNKISSNISSGSLKIIKSLFKELNFKISSGNIYIDLKEINNVILGYKVSVNSGNFKVNGTSKKDTYIPEDTNTLVTGNISSGSAKLYY